MDKRKKQRRKRRAFTPEFKAEAVRLCKVGERGRPSKRRPWAWSRLPPGLNLTPNARSDSRPESLAIEVGSLDLPKGTTCRIGRTPAMTSFLMVASPVHATIGRASGAVTGRSELSTHQSSA